MSQPTESHAAAAPRPLWIKPAAALSFLPVLVVVCLYRYVLRGINDDAMITYRYARNLANGLGFVYNPGEHVLGTTTPLYTLLVSAAIKSGLEPWHFSLITDCFFVTGLIALLFFWLRTAGDALPAWLGTIALLHSPSGLMPLAGMETGLFNILTYGCLYAAMRDKPAASVPLGFLSLLTRPEGVVALGIALIAALYDPATRRIRRSGLLYWVAAAVAVGVYALALYLYFGSVIPQSVVAKRVQSAVGGTWTPFIGSFFDQQFRPFGALTLLGVLEWIGIGLILWRLPRLRILAAWFLLYLGFMAVGRAPFYVWYLSPLYPVRTIAAVYAAVYIAGWISSALPLTSRGDGAPLLIRGADVVFLSVVLLVAFGWNYLRLTWLVFRWGVVQDYPVLFCKKYEEAGVYIHKWAESGDVVLTPEIGYVGYLSEAYIFDPVGLVTPGAVADGNMRSMWEWAIDRKPDWVVMSWFQASGFQPLPVEFVSSYMPDAMWRDTVFETSVFGRRKTSTNAFVASSATPVGYLPLAEEDSEFVMETAWAVAPSQTSRSGFLVWEFLPDEPVDKLVFNFHPHDPELANSLGEQLEITCARGDEVGGGSLRVLDPGTARHVYIFEFDDSNRPDRVSIALRAQAGTYLLIYGVR